MVVVVVVVVMVVVVGGAERSGAWLWAERGRWQEVGRWWEMVAANGNVTRVMPRGNRWETARHSLGGGGRL